MPRGVYERTPEQRRKISAFITERNKAHRITEDGKRRLSEFNKGRYVGAKNPMWKGGVTPIRKKEKNSWEYRNWRKQVKERDGHKCVFCGSTKNLHADHIKPYATHEDLRYDLSNGRTLCFDCHKETPTYALNWRKIASSVQSNDGRGVSPPGDDKSPDN